jgi:hypothetical protein
MSMNKIVAPRSWDLGDVPVALIKRAQDRVGPNDLHAFVKRAGHRLADEMRRLQFAPGEIPIHLIAMGSTEYYSSNRNGDGFKEATLRRDHPSFVKSAYFFRDHCNNDPRRSYGIVKASFYNEDMHRVELICALNGTKEAAARNKGLLADREMDKLASGREIQVSMATRVPYDSCSFCHNKAPTRKEYCTHETCGGGGLRDNITATLKCGHILHADNPYCKFFDISHVTRGADPTAAVTGRLEKAASALLCGAELAERYAPGVPTWLEGENHGPLCKLARALDELDRGDLPVLSGLDHLPPLPAGVKLAEALRALVDEEVILSLPDYLHLASGDREKAAAVARATAPAMPGLFARLADSGEADTLAAQSGLDCPVSKTARVWAMRVSCGRAYKTAAVQRRIHAAAIRGEDEFCKRASAQMAPNPGADEVSRLYGGYALAALQLLEESHKENRLTRLALMAQNRF